MVTVFKVPKLIIIIIVLLIECKKEFGADKIIKALNNYNSKLLLHDVQSGKIIIFVNI